MEHSISRLAYKGSVIEAIAEAKRQKKLFVVYLSGENAESTRLEESSWMDSSVAESISKYSILLQILEGSIDAANLSAIYPQKPAPCITAIGYNGVQLWQNEGFISADVLASSLEKAWLSLHIQETILSAALASKDSLPLVTASSDQGSSSGNNVPFPSMDKHAQDSEAGASASTEKRVQVTADAEEEMKSKLHDEASHGSVHAEVDQSISVNESAIESSVAGDECAAPEESSELTDHPLKIRTEPSQVVARKLTESEEDKKGKVIQEDIIESEVTLDTSHLIANQATEVIQDSEADGKGEDKTWSTRSTDVFLNIRVLDAQLQQKFLLTSTLRMVKDFVDENKASTIGPYDLAIPYPRKEFNDEDLDKTLSELGLFGRQALIVVPRNRASGFYRGGSSSHNRTSSTTDPDSTNGSNVGYFTFLRRILSFMNPFSYLGGGVTSSNSAQESQSGMWQYNPNPALQNNLRGTGRPYTVYSSNQSGPTSGRNNSNNNRQATPSRYGSNIHTLKHDEDEKRFSERNSFWNGNSTEYGGDNDGK